MSRADDAPGGGGTILRSIVEALNAGEVEAARELCRGGLAASPDDPALNQLAATAALRSGLPGEAVERAERSLAFRPAHVATLALFGRAALAAGMVPAALERLTNAEAHAPGSADLAFLRAIAEVRNDASVATIDLDRLLGRFPAFASGWQDLAQALLERHDREAALLCLRAAGRAAPRFDLAMSRGLLARDLGRRPDARQAFEEATRLEPASARAWFLLGVEAQDANDAATATVSYARALRLDPGLAEAAVNLGIVRQRARDLDGAKAAYARAVAIRPDTFGRVAQAIATEPCGELWLDLRRFRRSLAG